MKKYLVWCGLLGVLLFGLVGVAAAQTDSSIDPKATEYYNAGSTQFGDGKYADAIESLTLAIQLQPDYVDAYSLRGLAHYLQAEFTDALSDFERSLELNPNDIYAHLLRGQSLRQTGDSEKALTDYQFILDNKDILPANLLVSTYFQRSLALTDLERYEEAISDLTHVIEMGDANVNAYYYRATDYLNIGNYERAIDDYTESIKLDDTHALAFVNRAFAYRHASRYDDALADLDTALKLEPNNIVAYFLRGKIYGLLGDYPRMLEAYQGYVRYAGDNANPMVVALLERHDMLP